MHIEVYFIFVCLLLRIVVINQQQRTKYEEKIVVNSNFLGATATSFSLTPPQILICKEAYNSIPMVMYTKKNFYLLDSINDKIESLKASGIINYWYFRPLQDKSLFHLNKIQKALNLKNLFSCFQVLLFGYFLSSLILAIEILTYFLMHIHKI
jgi:hypothetical protein